MKVKVTQEDIDKGQKGHAKKCAVALAVKRAVKDKVTVCAGGSLIIVGDENNERDYESPRKVEKFVEAFDEGKPVKPFSFSLK